MTKIVIRDMVKTMPIITLTIISYITIIIFLKITQIIIISNLSSIINSKTNSNHTIKTCIKWKYNKLKDSNNNTIRLTIISISSWSSSS